MLSKIFSALLLRIGISVAIDSSKKPLCTRYCRETNGAKTLYMYIYMYEGVESRAGSASVSRVC